MCSLPAGQLPSIESATYGGALSGSLGPLPGLSGILDNTQLLRLIPSSIQAAFPEPLESSPSAFIFY
jgi:hypothetical protein